MSDGEFSIQGTTEMLTKSKLIDHEGDLPEVMLALGYRTALPKCPHSRRGMDELVWWY